MKRTVLHLACICGLVVWGCGVWLALRQHESNQVLVLEKSDLENRVASLAALQEENARLRSHPSGTTALAAAREERTRNQAEIERLKQKLRAFSQEQEAQMERTKNDLDTLKIRTERGEAPQETAAFRQVSVGATISLASARNAGMVSPEALVETWLWAVREQELGTLEQITNDERSGTPLEDYPNPGVAGYRDWLSGVTDAALVDLQTNAVGQARMTVQLKRDSDSNPGEMTQLIFQLQRTGRQWKILRMGGR